MTSKIENVDCLEGMKELERKSIDLIIADFPYNEGKADWDRIPDYLEWVLDRVKLFEKVLKDNGSLYIYHMNFKTLMDFYNMITQETDFVFKQLIVIDKGIQSVAGRTSENLRSFPKATEYLLLFSKVNSELLRDYLRRERDKSGLTNYQCFELMGHNKGSKPQYFDKEQWSFPTKERYEKLQETGFFQLDYDELVRNFNLPMGVTDVWQIDFYDKFRSNGHDTPKPRELSQRIIKASSNEGDTILVPCVGSGSEVIESKRLRRNYIGFETNPDYVRMVKKKLSQVQPLEKLTVEQSTFAM